MPTDTERLDWMDDQAAGTYRWVARDSDTGRGFRLHNTSREPNYETVREAIDAAIAIDNAARKETPDE